MKSARHTFAIACTAAVVLLTAVAVVGVIFRHRWNWGDFPSWITAVTTTMVAAATLVAYRLYKIESNRDVAAAEERRRLEQERAERREEDRRSQASKVAAWFGPEQNLRAAEEDPFMLWGAIIRNASDLPILDVRIFFYYVVDPEDGRPWEPVICGIPVEKFRIIPPGVERFLFLDEEFQGVPVGASQSMTEAEVASRNLEPLREDMYVVGIEFSDAAANRWRREARGGLVPVG